MAQADGLIRGGSHERGEENVSSFLGFPNFSFSLFSSLECWDTKKATLEFFCLYTAKLAQY